RDRQEDAAGRQTRRQAATRWQATSGGRGLMPTGSRRGFILVAVLWTIALLSALAMATSVTFREFAGIVTVDRDRLRAEALLTAGLEIAAGVIAHQPEDRPLSESEMAFRLSTGQIRVRVTDEGGRIDIGKA